MRSRRNALTQERADLIAEARAIFDGSEDRDLTEDEGKRDDEIQARLEEIAPALARLERQEAREGLTPPTQTVETASTGDGDGDGDDPDKLPTPFKSFGAQLAAVVAAAGPGAAVDPRLLEIQAAAGASEGVGSEGGFLVQTDFSAQLLRRVHETGRLARLCDDTPIGPNANGLKINAIDESSRADGSRWGGVRGYWTGEAEEKTATKPKYRQMELSLHKLTGLYYATDELLMDTVALGQEAQTAFAEEFGFKVDDALIRGTGAGMPLGILGHVGTVSVAKETGQVAATIMAENVEKMWARMWARSLPGGIWFINQDCWPQLFQLHHVVGTGGVPMFMLPGSLPNAPFGALLGRPVQPIEQCATLGTVGDIIFADFAQYKTISKGGIAAASSIHVRFIYDETTFRFVLRMDGQPKWNTKLTPAQGSNTQSSFITLATRA